MQVSGGEDFFCFHVCSHTPYFLVVGQIGHQEQKVGHLASLLYVRCNADWFLRTRTVPPKVEQLVTPFVSVLPYKCIL